MAQYRASTNIKIDGRRFRAGDVITDADGKPISEEEGKRLFEQGQANKDYSTQEVERASKLVSVEQYLNDRSSNLTSELKSVSAKITSKQKKLGESGLDKKEAAELESEIEALNLEKVALQAKQEQVKEILGRL